MPSWTLAPPGRCIIGAKTLECLKQALPCTRANKFRKKESQVRFRFGNNAALTGREAVRIPLKQHENRPSWISVEVVPGLIPFLFSKRAFKLLHGSLHDMCWMPKLQKEPIPLATSPTGLYLLNLMDICPLDEAALFHDEPKTSSHKIPPGTGEDIISKSVQVPISKEVDGANPFSNATVKFSVGSQQPMLSLKRFVACVIEFVSDRPQPYHDSDGRHTQHHCRSHHPFAHTASDLYASTGRTGSCRGDGVQARPDDSLQLQEMMQQIQVQKTVLHSLKNEFGSQSMASGPSVSAGSSIVPTTSPGPTVVHRQSKLPSVTSQPPSRRSRR